jgi:hypothetical protein
LEAIVGRITDRLDAVSQACGDGTYGGQGIRLVDDADSLVIEVEVMIHG